MCIRDRDEDCYEERTILDHSSGEISTEDAAVLMEALSKGLAKDGYHFYVGTMVWISIWL